MLYELLFRFTFFFFFEKIGILSQEFLARCYVTWCPWQACKQRTGGCIFAFYSLYKLSKLQVWMYLRICISYHQVLASLVYADSEAPVEKPTDGEAPLLTSYDGLEFDSSDRPSKLIQGRASFKLKISQVLYICTSIILPKTTENLLTAFKNFW